MPIDDSAANFLSKAGDSDDGITVQRVVPVVSQADGTGEDASAAFPLPTSDASVTAGVGAIDLAVAAQAETNTQTVKGTAEEIAGATAFTAGATVEIVGLDTAVYPGTTKAQAELNAISAPAGVPIRVKLVGVTVWIDAATDGTYTVAQVTA